MAGRSLEDLMATTHIGKSYLIAMEEGRFERLPSPAHAKGFLRLYAQCVGISGDEVVRSFNECILSPLDSKSTEGQGVPSPRPGGIRWSRRWGVTVILLLAVLASALVMDLSSPQRPAALLPAKTPERSTAPEPLPQAKSESSTLSPSPPVPVNDEQAASLPTAKPLSGGVFLRIRATQECWLAIDIDGELSHQYTLKEGDIIEWKGERQFSLDIGNPAGIQVEFNGTPHPLPVVGSKPVHLVLAADGAR
jgi:cytoskeletal protein RodZ